ncbi:MAG: homocysteine S-methyltransferase family protein [Parasporobacterium sp.]|nr:homocysteine S-methyltransferase family protein [Parasporobacterium sp.]
MYVLDCVKNQITFFDGGMGALLQKYGLGPGEAPENWNIEKKDIIVNVQADYFRAGTNIITTNSFGANTIKYKAEGKHELKDVIKAAIENAKEARKIVEAEGNTAPHFVAFDVSATGKLIEPLGDLSFDEALKCYEETIGYALESEPDLIIIETMTDIFEAKAALLAAKKLAKIPVFVTCAFDDKSRLLTGSEVEEVVAVLEGLGADAVGINCSLGPEQMKPMVEKFVKYASVPVIVNPNAGLPRMEDGKTFYDVTPDIFAGLVSEFAKMGVSIVGGCCGTTHDHIKALVKACEAIKAQDVVDKEKSYIASATRVFDLNIDEITIGCAINPDNADIKEAIDDEDLDTFVDEAMDQADDDIDVIGINVGESPILKDVILEVQGMVKNPFMIECKDEKLLGQALSCVNGKALVKLESEDIKNKPEFLKTVKKFGGLIFVSDVNEGNEAEVESLLESAKSAGLNKKDIVFNCDRIKFA